MGCSCLRETEEIITNQESRTKIKENCQEEYFSYLYFIFTLKGYFNTGQYKENVSNEKNNIIKQLNEYNKDKKKLEILIGKKEEDINQISNNNNITIPDISNQTQSLKSKGDNYTFEKPKDDNNIESELTNKKEEEINNKTNEKENENNNNLSEDQVRIKEEET